MKVALILVGFENLSYLINKEKSVWGMTAIITKIASIDTNHFGDCIEDLLDIVDFHFWDAIDRIWMILVLVMPIFFAAHGMRTEPGMVVSIVNQPRES